MDQLKQTLQQLHQQLEQADDADPELQQWLRVLDQDIHKLLEARDAGGDAAVQAASTDDGGEDLATRADDVARRFAARHPQLAPVLRQITDALARLGI